jgi:hypothetical protein
LANKSVERLSIVAVVGAAPTLPLLALKAIGARGNTAQTVAELPPTGQKSEGWRPIQTPQKPRTQSLWSESIKKVNKTGYLSQWS